MGREARAARREAGSEARAANGREGAWRCREEEVGGGRGRRKLRPLTRAGWDALGGHGGSVRGKREKGTVRRRSSPEGKVWQEGSGDQRGDANRTPETL